MSKIIIFIDDLRKPDIYIDTKLNDVYQVLTYNDFITLLHKLYLKFGKIDEVWFDHDLGENSNGNGYDCAKYLVIFCENNNMPLPDYHIHSANPVGRKNIDSYLKSYIKSLNI